MPDSESTREIESSETIVEMGRLAGLSDGVFAISLTLLVLDIRIPEVASADDLPARLLELAPRFAVYLLSFIVIGGAWGSHQRMLSQIKRGDGVLVWLNLLSLLFVTLLPASSAVLGRFPTTFTAILIFSIDVILIQLSALWVWRHAGKHALVNPALDPRVVSGIGRRLILSAMAFGLSLPLALLNTALVYIAWVALFALIFTTDWLSWQQALKTTQASIPLNGATRAHIRLRHGIGHLQVNAGAVDGTLANGTFGGGLDTHIQQHGDLLDVQMSISKKGGGFLSWRFPWAWSSANVLDWTLCLNNHIPIALSIETSSSQTDLDLSELFVSELNLKASASSFQIELPAHAGQTVVVVQASAASVDIHVPPEVAARIRAEMALTGVEVDLSRFGMVKDGREYRSEMYDTAANRVDIRLEITVSSVKIV